MIAGAGSGAAGESVSMAPISTVYVESWAAVMLSAADGTAHRRGSCAEDSIIPAAYRRRLGTHGRLAVTCGLSIAAADNSDLVFCSQYGDVDLAYKLLTELVAGGLLSPAAFSLSVHNAAPGVMDLVRKNGVGHTAIAAGSQSLSAGLVEAWAKLIEKPQRKIALVYADCAPPEVYREFSDMKMGGTALAMTLSAQKPDKPSGWFVPQVKAGDDALNATNSEDLAALLVDALEGSGTSPHWRSRGVQWSFTAGSDAVS